MRTVADLVYENLMVAKLHPTGQALESIFPGTSSLPRERRQQLYRFVSERPLKFFDREAFLGARHALLIAPTGTVAKLAQHVFDETLSALQYLRSVNNAQQDSRRPRDHHDELRVHRLHTSVFGDYSRIAEHVLGPLLGLLLELATRAPGRTSNVPRELRSRWEMARGARNGLAPALTRNYNPTIRNSIVHGGVKVEEYELSFTDLNGTSVRLSHSEAEGLAERLLDTCNGVAAALALALAQDEPIAVPLQPWGRAERAIALARTPYLRPQAAYLTQHATSQAELHGGHTHWNRNHLVLDIVRGAVILKEVYPNVGHYFLAFRPTYGVPSFFGFPSAEVPEQGESIEALGRIGAKLGERGLAWVEHQRLFSDLLGRTRFGPFLNWVDAVDRGGGAFDYELRDMQDISVKWSSRFRAHVVSSPRAEDLSDDGKPTAEYLKELFFETMFRWLVRDRGPRPPGANRLRLFDLAMIDVSAEDRRHRGLVDAGLGENFLFRLQWSLRNNPGVALLGSRWEWVWPFRINLNPAGYARLRKIKGLPAVSATG